MKYGDPPDYSHDEGNLDRLRGIITPDAVLVDLVSAFAGDRAMTETEDSRMRDMKNTRVNVFFSDLLCAISHATLLQKSPPDSRRIPR
jgi:hypothetical protein